jgi:hypothetical protein
MYEDIEFVPHPRYAGRWVKALKYDGREDETG